jgi:hypothetical protein
VKQRIWEAYWTTDGVNGVYSSNYSSNREQGDPFQVGSAHRPTFRPTGRLGKGWGPHQKSGVGYFAGVEPDAMKIEEIGQVSVVSALEGIK